MRTCIDVPGRLLGGILITCLGAGSAWASTAVTCQEIHAPAVGLGVVPFGGQADRDESGFYRFDFTGAASLVISRFRFPGDEGDPGQVDVAALQEQWAHSSYGRRSFVVTETPLVELPYSRDAYNEGTGTYYINDLDDRLETEHGVHTHDFDYRMRVARRGRPFITNNGGQAELTGPASLISAPGNDYVVAHELGHNHGFRHASLWLANADGAIIGAGKEKEYGNDHDIMAHGRRDFGAALKWYVNWLRNEEIHIVTASGTYEMRAHDLGQLVDGARYGLLIDREAQPFGNSQTGYYFFEFRQNAAQASANKGLLGLVHRDSPWNVWTHLLDMTPDSGETWKDAALLVGRTFSDPDTGVHVTPTDLSGSGLDAIIAVRVELGTFEDNTAPTASLAIDTAQPAIGMPVRFTCTAEDAEDGSDLAYHWQFGDDTLSSTNDSSIAYTWDSAGSTTVQCTVSDMRGGVVTVQTTVDISDAITPRALGIALDRSGHEPLVDHESGTITPTGTDSWRILGIPASTDIRIDFTPAGDG